MKKLFLTILVLFLTINVQSQIALEHTYTKNVSAVHFASGYKYYNVTLTATNSGVINIYNLNHSLYKSITTPSSIPHTQSHFFPISIAQVSDSLFNTSTSNIEYLVCWLDTTTFKYNSRIYNDAGTLLFSDTLLCQYVYYTTNGWKMNCNGTGTHSHLYSLPGAILCDECNKVNSGLGTDNNENKSSQMNVYPNPSSNAVTIDYKLPEGVNQGELVFYDLQGREVKRFKVDNSFTSLIITTTDISAGTYYSQLQTSKEIIGGKKIIIIK